MSDNNGKWENSPEYAEMVKVFMEGIQARDFSLHSRLLPDIPQEEPKAHQQFVGEHGKLYTVSSGKEYRWVTNHPKYPEGVWIPPEMEWESGVYHV